MKDASTGFLKTTYAPFPALPSYWSPPQSLLSQAGQLRVLLDSPFLFTPFFLHSLVLHPSPVSQSSLIFSAVSNPIKASSPNASLPPPGTLLRSSHPTPPHRAFFCSLTVHSVCHIILHTLRYLSTDVSCLIN